MKQRTLMSLAFIAVLVLLFFSRSLSTFIFDTAIGIIIIFCAVEMSKMLSKMGRSNYFLVIGFYPSAAYLVLMLSVFKEQSIGMCILWQVVTLCAAFILTFVISLFLKKKLREEMKLREIRYSYRKFALVKTLNTMIGLVYPTFLMMFIIMASSIDKFSADLTKAVSFTNNSLSLLVLLLIVLIPSFTDTFAYLAGSLFGGPKPFKKVSPNKTITGYIAGTVFCVIFICIIYLIIKYANVYKTAFNSTGINMLHFAVVSFVGSIICHVGDFVESLFKRIAKIKDSGNLLPGFGGFLDRFDSYIFSAIFIFSYFAIVLT